jgi:hypothetical protein
VDEQVVADAAKRIGDLATEVYARGHQTLAREIAEQLKRVQKQLKLNRPAETPCKKCGRPVPDVPIGRPRLYCEEHRRSRAKVADFGEPRETVRS